MTYLLDMFRTTKNEKGKREQRKTYTKIESSSKHCKAAGEFFVDRSKLVHINKSYINPENTKDNAVVEGKSKIYRRNGISELSHEERYGLYLVLRDHIRKSCLKNFEII